MASLPSYPSRRRRLKISTVNCDSGGLRSNITSIAALPAEILILILEKLDLLEFHRINAVCRSWRQCFFKPQFLKPQFPWLMLSFSESRRDFDHQGFFSAFYGKVYRLEIPKVRGARCCGSNRGWLIMLSGVEGCMFLYNPFTRVRIELPPKSTLPRIGPPFLFDEYEHSRNYLRKAMLLSPGAATNNFNLNENKVVSSASMTATDDCLVVALCLSSHLTFSRPGDTVWTPSTTEYRRSPNGIEDFIVYDGRLYAVKLNYDLVLLELLPQIRERSCGIAPPPAIDTSPHQKFLYLVESRGELLLVTRRVRFDLNDLPPPTADLNYDPNFDYESPTTDMFWIFRLDLLQRRWIKVEDLGDQMLFIGTNIGFSVSALHYHGFKGNSIYFTDDYSHNMVAIGERFTACDDLGVFQLEDNSIEFNIYPTSFHSYASPPIWFAPIV